MTAMIAHRVGTGAEKVLVLHGWFGAGVYDKFFNAFDLSRYEFLVVENPGYGVARHHQAAKNITDLAEQQLKLVDSLGWGEFQIIGHSYGGAAALRIASLTTNRVRRLIGIAPVMPVGFDSIAAKNCGADEHTGPAFMGAFAKGPKAADGPRMIAAALDPILASDESAMDKLIDQLYSSISEETYRQYFLVWTGCSFLKDVTGLSTPSLFLLGESDPFAASNYVQGTVDQMAPGAVRVKSIPGGHFLTVSGRIAAASAIQAFID